MRRPSLLRVACSCVSPSVVRAHTRDESASAAKRSMYCNAQPFRTPHAAPIRAVLFAFAVLDERDESPQVREVGARYVPGAAGWSFAIGHRFVCRRFRACATMSEYGRADTPAGA